MAFIKISAELLEDYLADPEIITFREWFDDEARRQLASPLMTQCCMAMAIEGIGLGKSD